jgi:hypothetical protein
VHPSTRLQSLAPILDAACIVVFVALGRDRHGIDQGVDWWFTVLWPLFLGWFSVALAVRLYTRRSSRWSALLVTLAVGIAVASLFRGTFTDRPYVGIFTIIAVVFIGLTTFGWRAAAGLLAARRPIT